MDSNSPGQNVTFLSSTYTNRAPRLVFLAIIFIAAFFGSLFIIIVFIQSLKLRTAQNIFIANVCVVCIADCLINMSLVFGALTMDEWIYGDFVCKVNNFCMHLVAIEALLMLTLMTAHRYFTVRLSTRYEAWLSSRRLYTILIYVWLHCLSFSLPFLTQVVQTVFRPRLHLCTVASESPVGFMYTFFVFCFIAPIIVSVVFHVLGLKLSRQLSCTSGSENAMESYSQITQEKFKPSRVGNVSYYSFYLSIIWFVLEMPFVVMSYLKFYDESNQEIYPWQLDATFVWMRFSFSSIFPFITFLCNKELWQSVKEWVLCRKNNAINSMDIIGITSNMYVQKESSLVTEKSASPKCLNDIDKDKKAVKSFNVPVLFATSTGICVADSTFNSAIGSDCYKSAREILEMKGKTLDIVYSDYEYMNEIFDDTSDYDSSCEIDPYSTSQPVSSWRHPDHLVRTRSMSDPEVNVRISFEVKKTKAKEKRISGTSGTDSGLDLSQAAGIGSGSTASKSAKSKESPTKINQQQCCSRPTSNSECGCKNHNEKVTKLREIARKNLSPVDVLMKDIDINKNQSNEDDSVEKN